MRQRWFSVTILFSVFSPFLTSAFTLPALSHSSSNSGPFSNDSQKYIQCLPKSNVTHAVYDSPLELAITLGRRPIPPWQATLFLETVLVSIKTNASVRPFEYIPDDYYYYHKHDERGAISVIPSFVRDFTWSDLYLVLHGLAEYVVAAPHAYEMCVEIVFRTGGLAGVIYFNWWMPFSGLMGLSLPRDAGNLRLLGSKVLLEGLSP